MNFTKEDLGGKNPQFYSKRNCLWCNKEFVYRIKLDAKFCCASCSSLHKARNTDAFAKTKATKLKKYEAELQSDSTVIIFDATSCFG